LADAKNAFASIAEELIEVAVGGKRLWLLRGDRKALSSPSEPKGIRLLPVLDPFLQQRDRATVLPDEATRRKLWQPTRGPGGVLVGGEIIGTWRAQTKKARLDVAVSPFRPLVRGTRSGIESEAERIAPFRGCESVAVTFTD
jgi:hypothetical protein